MQYLITLFFTLATCGICVAQVPVPLAIQQSDSQDASLRRASGSETPGTRAAPLQLLARQVRTHIVNHLRYPKTRSTGIEGIVEVEVHILPDGQIKQGIIVNSLHPQFDAAVMDALESLQSVQVSQDTPDSIHRVIVPVHFSLSH